MGAVELLSVLQRRGAVLTVSPNRLLRVEAPEGALSNAFRQAIRLERDELIRLLQKKMLNQECGLSSVSAASASSALRAHPSDLRTVQTQTTESHDPILGRTTVRHPDLDAFVPADASFPWDGEDWQTYFDERAATREYDGEIARPEAERLALEDAIESWLTVYLPSPSDPNHGCAFCGGSNMAGIPLLSQPAQVGLVWTHEECRPAWREKRRAVALQSFRDRRLTWMTKIASKGPLS